jgi:hypothetical protein
MKFFLIASVVFTLFSKQFFALNYGKLCCVRDEECLMRSIDAMFVILRKMNKTISPDSVTVERDFSEQYDLDIASGSATLHKCEVHNILSAQVKSLKSRVNGDHIYVLIDLLVPSIHGIA